MVEIREQSMHETLFKLFPKLNKPTNGIGMTEIITFFLPLIMVSTSTQNLSIFSTLISRCLACNHACNSWAFVILFLLRLLSIVIRSCGFTPQAKGLRSDKSRGSNSNADEMAQTILKVTLQA